MFYANFILAKKGPLAKIWLAAHWEKKLSKAHVFETDLQSSVESIIAPKVKIALRTSGHLLLGVVRIYSRKAKYLLADCTEALIKIKMAFRPGLVDLPEESREAQMAAITLPEIQEWDAIVNDLNNFDIQAQINLNQSRVEEITMKEDLVSMNFITDDNFFGDTPFGETNEKEILRAGSAFDESVYKESDASKITIEEEKDELGDKSTASKSTLDIALDEPIRDDGFGGGEGMDFFEGFGAGEGIVPGFEDLGAEPGPTNEEPLAHDVTLEPLDITLTKEDEKEKPKEPEVSQGESLESPEAVVPVETVNETTLLPNDQEAFALEPIEVSVGKDKRKRRKRKLVVDDKKNLTGDQIRAQLADTSDIVQAANVAPPTKLRMKLKETSTIKSLFSMPAIPLHSDKLLERFKKNLTTEISTEDAPELSSQEEEPMDIDMHGRDEDVAPEHAPDEPYAAPAIDDLPPIHDLGDAPDMGTVLGEDIQGEGVAQEEDIAYEEDAAQRESGEQEEDQGEDPISGEDQSVILDETQEQKRWTKRAQQMLHTLNRELRKKSDVGFDKLSKGNNRKQASYKFYTLLILNKEKAVTVSEDVMYGKITIGKGDKFDDMV